MAKPKDLYAILGVGKTATADEIRKAYRKLARQLHPDVNPGNKQAEEKFKDVSLAYDVLTDTEKRRLYDEFGHDGLQAGFDPARARAYRQWAGSGRGFAMGGGPGEGFDFSGFENVRRGGGRRGAEGGGFADILSDLFGGGMGGGARETQAPPRAGQDIESPLEVDFLDALRGTQMHVTVRRPGPCAACGGSGRQGRRGCPACSGGGTVEQRERLSVKIPAGVGDGARVRVAGKGGFGGPGRPGGDLYFVIKVRPHPALTRDGKDLTLEVPVTVPEAMRGGTITVPTPAGRVQLKLPKGSQSGQRLRLKGRGVPDPKGGQPGDLYVRLMVQVPPPGGDEKLRDAVDALEQAYSGDPRANLSF
ncbi:MAG: DnaJ C-terminal domain-containing protein [Candidatus Binatia bacterium]